jgi:O-antigen/teichoic acid export membrane protein
VSILKKLAGQTAIYGLSSIVGRFLNYLLVPLHTAVFVPAQYGVITEMYAYVAFLIILLTYGMETAYFRFSNTEGRNEPEIFSTVLASLMVTTLGSVALAALFAQPLAEWLLYPDHREYVLWFVLIIGLDALASVPLARLRAQNRPVVFASVNLINVLVYIALNAFFLLYCLPKVEAGQGNWLTDTFYDPTVGVGYVFIANLVASALKLALLLPFMLRDVARPRLTLLRPMLIYALPLLVAGLAGMVNETLDRILLKRLLIPTLGTEGAMHEVGIYGACYKISIVISLMVQAFRYAAEPFFFAQQKEAGSAALYARIMSWFTWVLSGTFLGVMLYIGMFQRLIANPVYWQGLQAVPVLLLANIFLGMYYNQSVWYKLTNRTGHGAAIAIGGAIITLVVNFALIPTMGYMASAWATLACYGSMMVASYLLGQHYYPVPYQVGRLALFIVAGVGLWALSMWLHVGQSPWWWALNVPFLLAYLLITFPAVRRA